MKIKKIIHQIFRRDKKLSYINKAKQLKRKYSSLIYWSDEGNDKLSMLLDQKKPVLISRLGSVELFSLIAKKNNGNYDATIKFALENNAGFFPATEDNIDKFKHLYFSSITNIDALGVWFNSGEASIQKKYCPSCLLVELSALNSFLYDHPYTSILKGKKVLVIHPFVNSIEHQYKKKETLFANQNVLPEFNLILLKSPQTIAGNHDGYADWFDAYQSMCNKIDSIDFDIAVLGCGAYGLPLGAYIKSKGKSAIHMGGALQLLFGIKGKRWVEEYDYGKTLFNENWIYPLESDKPTGFSKVENGCYW